VSAAQENITPVLDEASRKAVAARVRYYRELGIYDLYRREVAPMAAPGGMSVGRAIVREELARVAEESADTIRSATPHSPESEADVGHPPAADAAKLAAMLADKPGALRVIREEIGDCTRCKLSRGRTNIVFGVGNPRARILFVGEGPGADEDAQGEPFVGRAGQLLNNMIQAMGIAREDVYIANVVKCRPPDNRTPERDECETCGPFLMRQIAVVRPEIIVALGATAAKFLLGTSDSMANLRGHLYDFHPTRHPMFPQGAPERDPGFAAKLVVTYHPAYLLRDPRQKKEAWLDLQRVMTYLGMPLPRRNPEG
jgi:uracil-DNA glycosylase family 4